MGVAPGKQTGAITVMTAASRGVSAYAGDGSAAAEGEVDGTSGDCPRRTRGVANDAASTIGRRRGSEEAAARHRGATARRSLRVSERSDPSRTIEPRGGVPDAMEVRGSGWPRSPRSHARTRTDAAARTVDDVAGWAPRADVGSIRHAVAVRVTTRRNGDR